MQRTKGLADLLSLSEEERAAALVGAGLSEKEARDVENVVQVLPSVELDVSIETEGEAEVEEGDLVTLNIWMAVKRLGGGPALGVAHCPAWPRPVEESWWLFLLDGSSNVSFASQKIAFSDLDAAADIAKKAAIARAEAGGKEREEAVEEGRRVGERVGGGELLLSLKFPAPAAGSYQLQLACISNAWLGCDRRVPLKLKVPPRMEPARAKGPQYLASSEV